MSTEDPACDAGEHDLQNAGEVIDAEACQNAAALFGALGDASRLHILCLIMQGEMCVTDIARRLDDNMSAVSQRLKLLRSERIVKYRREGKHVFYSLVDAHIRELVSNAIAHASE